MAGSSTQAFPKFGDGDVLLIISTTQYYKLHSQVLSTHSQWFAEQIAAKPAPRLNAQARRENAAAYRFELQAVPVGEGPGRFIRIDVNESGRSPRSSLPMMPNFENGKVESMTNQCWDWLFGVFYNREPRFDDGSLASVLTCVMGLIEVAESVNAIDQVRDIVDLALMRQDAVLWTSIMGNPVVWIELGRRVRSPAIYREAAIHLIGQWGMIADEDKDRIGGDIRAVLDRKAEELALAKEAIEMRILGHYPAFMTRTAAEKPGRPSYSGDIYMWMSVCFFRQWFAQNISDDRTRRAPDGGLNFYSALHEGGGAYLTHLDFKTFHQYFPMSIKACHVLEANMGVLKEDVKQFVSELMEERTHLKRAEHPITWLTCARVGKEDMPWFPEASTSRPGSGSVPSSSSSSSSSAARLGATRRRQDEELRKLYDALSHENEAMLMAAAAGQSQQTQQAQQHANKSANTGRQQQRGKKRARVYSSDDEGYEDDENENENGDDVVQSLEFPDDAGVDPAGAGAAAIGGPTGSIVGDMGGLAACSSSTAGGDELFGHGDGSGMFLPEGTVDFMGQDEY
ncbi:hypothetical protein PV08_11293 [Exophiala spinifera]|uniref:BTB domain-containing protein n=1 Tax=Exophiala spinifera TaxID=91928 RepID=A0A0D1Y603_9EURO|nr:uncharacterized protein PV08_11293 [Exophiala spinifera]KIW10331.1 hypothetical protein PV08_11293 [Exophiala spinifera]